jgi:hypothetical protein
MTSAEVMKSEEMEASTSNLTDLERKLREGREVSLNLKQSSNVSVLTNPAIDAGANNPEASAKSNIASTMTTDVVSKSNIDLLEETERLLAKMQNLSGSSPAAEDMPNLNVDHSENSSELNEMLDKAGQLSHMMQSISENISLHGGETPSLIRHSDQMLQEAGYCRDGSNSNLQDTPNFAETDALMASMNASVVSSRSKRDPDGEFGKPKKQRNRDPDACSPGLTATSTDEASDQHHRHEDPPGSHAGVPEDNEDKRASPLRGLGMSHRPASLVHLNHQDDDVSSVGSASFRPYPYNNQSFRGEQEKTPISLAGSSPQEKEKDVIESIRPTPDDLLRPGFKMPSPDGTPADDDEADNNIATPDDDVNASTSLSVVDSSSPRKASAGVQWEKLSTAAPGEDDYVPLVDYSHVRPKKSPRVAPVGTRLEQLRKRNQARRRRKIRAVAAVMLCATGFVYYLKSKHGGDVQFEEEGIILEEEDVMLWKSFDTSVFPEHLTEGGYCLEADDESWLVTMPKVEIPVVEEVVEENQDEDCLAAGSA